MLRLTDKLFLGPVLLPESWIYIPFLDYSEEQVTNIKNHKRSNDNKLSILLLEGVEGVDQRTDRITYQENETSLYIPKLLKPLNLSKYGLKFR